MAGVINNGVVSGKEVTGVEYEDDSEKLTFVISSIKGQNLHKHDILQNHLSKQNELSDKLKSKSSIIGRNISVYRAFGKLNSLYNNDTQLSPLPSSKNASSHVLLAPPSQNLPSNIKGAKE